MTRGKYFWPLFAVGIFCFKVSFIAFVIYVSITRAAPIEGPGSAVHTPAEQLSTASQDGVREEPAS